MSNMPVILFGIPRMTYSPVQRCWGLWGSRRSYSFGTHRGVCVCQEGEYQSAWRQPVGFQGAGSAGPLLLLLLLLYQAQSPLTQILKKCACDPRSLTLPQKSISNRICLHLKFSCRAQNWLATPPTADADVRSPRIATPRTEVVQPCTMH